MFENRQVAAKVLTLTLPLGLFAAGFAAVAYYAWADGALVETLLAWNFEYQVLFEKKGVAEQIEALRPQLQFTMAPASVALMVGFIVGFLRNRIGLWSLRVAYAFGALGALVLFISAWQFTELLPALADADKSYMLETQTFFWYRLSYIFPALAVLTTVAVLYVLSFRSDLLRMYTGLAPAMPTFADRLFENIRTHGRDPQYRKSNYNSALVHFMVLIGIPWLISLFGCIKPYRLPFGEGSPAVAKMQVQVVQKKKKKKLILNPKSSIRFDFPEIDDSEIEKVIDQVTQRVYEANLAARGGAMGGGKQGKGGWPEGWMDGKIRFIRLRYNGRLWDDGMKGKGNADSNFLAWFKLNSGANFPVATDGEAHQMRLLSRYPKGQAPPFVYMTGDGWVRASSYDIKALRDYMLKDGGMLFADAGSPEFDRGFRHFMRLVFPDKDLRVISDDDPIYQFPFRFPAGAPPLWHHGGYQPKGIKHKGRWIVYYHPGDVNDAWKDGHSGVDPDTAESAFQLGTNVIYHSIMHYVRINRKYMN